MNIEDFLKKLSKETERGREVKKKKKGKEKSVKLGHISAPVPSSKKKNKIKPPKPKKKKKKEKIEPQVYYDRIGRTVAIDDFLVYFNGMKGFRVYYVSMMDKEGRFLVCLVSGRFFDSGGEVLTIPGAHGLWFSRKTWYLDEILPKNSFFVMKSIDKNKKIFSFIW